MNHVQDCSISLGETQICIESGEVLRPEIIVLYITDAKKYISAKVNYGSEKRARQSTLYDTWLCTNGLRVIAGMSFAFSFQTCMLTLWRQ